MQSSEALSMADSVSNQPNEPFLAHMKRINQDLIKKVERTEGAVEFRNLRIPESIYNLSYEKLSQSLKKLPIDGEEQKITPMEYLRSDQQLIIPAALAMSPLIDVPERCKVNKTLMMRYWYLTGKSYTEIREMVEPVPLTIAEMRKKADEAASSITIGTSVYEEWNKDAYYEEHKDDPYWFADIVFRHVSYTLQFNCDVRDFGFLINNHGYTTDDAWKTAEDTPADRLRNKLKLYSIYSIAALNLEAVQNEPLAALVRAYGLGFGLLPDPKSAFRVEYRFTLRFPTDMNEAVVGDFSKDFGYALLNPCAQLLAMFGLMHLATDGSFRIGASSYLRTLGSVIPSPTLVRLIADSEPYVRTAQHPFGPAQTYWFAKALNKHGRLAPDLARRVDVTPPAIQPLMIANAARKEWSNLPSHSLVNRLFMQDYEALEDCVEAVVRNAPSYSGLHLLYGVDSKMAVPAGVRDAVEKMMPAVYGFIAGHHQEELNRRARADRDVSSRYVSSFLGDVQWRLC